jgi:hypothetical protein
MGLFIPELMKNELVKHNLFYICFIFLYVRKSKVQSESVIVLCSHNLGFKYYTS